MPKTANLLDLPQHKLGLVLAYMLVLAPGVGTLPANASQVLRIATWDLAHTDAAVFKAPKSKQPTWRHTFGSERQDRKPARLGTFNLDVDVVLLQGVHNIYGLRRVFPPRHWKLIISRDYMHVSRPLSRLPMDLQAFDISTLNQSSSNSVTAIAVRYQRGLRVRGINHISLDTRLQDVASKNEPHPKALATLLNYYGLPLWLVSMRLPASCREQEMTCSAWDDFKTTLQKRLERQGRSQYPVIAGITRAPAEDGDQARTPPDVSNPHCGRLTPVFRRKKGRVALGYLHERTRKKLGCIVIGDIKLLQSLPHQIPLTPPTQSDLELAP